MHRLKLTTALVAVLALPIGITACNNADNPSETQTEVSAEPILGSFGVALENMDTTVDPGDDFFSYVNGTWLKETELPADKSSYGSFGVLADQAEERVKGIIQDAADADAPGGSAERRIGDMYAAFMDTDAIEDKGLTPLQGELDAISALSSHEEIFMAMGDPNLQLTGPFSPYVYIDRKDPTRHVAYASQSGLGMPDKDYYLDEGEKADGLRAAYLELITTTFTLAGFENAAERAQAVMDFETRLAETHWSRTQSRNRDLTYNPYTWEELDEYAPGVPWKDMAAAAGIVGTDGIIFRQNTAIKDGVEVFIDTPVDVVQDYLRFHLISDYSAYLPESYNEANFAFYGKALRGTQEQRDRWKRGVSLVNGNLGELVGKTYVERYFPESSKEQMKELVENLRAVFKEGIDNLEWMSAETKAQAQYKLAKFNPKIGYPDKWENYDGINVDRSDLIGTVKSARMWQWQDNVSKLGQPIDRDEWGMNPQRVNAYYNASLNEIVFPAAILDAPFFDPNADPAVNYGGIGAVIGHEMGHGFDDQGRKSDGDGRERDWWTPADAENFKARSDRLVAQYNEFEALPGIFLNGERSLGENIGDLTGVTMAYKAYKRSLNGQEAPVIDGFTGDQRFFLAYGQIWNGKYTDAALENRIKTGVHSPGKYRTNGIVRNFGPWYDAFDVTEDDDLYLAPEDRVSIWE